MITNEFLQVQKALEKLPATLQRKVVVGATRAAATVIAKDARENVPVDTGLLKKSIAVRSVPKKETEANHVKFYVVPLSKNYVSGVLTSGGAKFGTVKFDKRVYYAHMVEFGTENMAARPFMRPAFENSASKSVNAFQTYALKRTEKELKKLAVR